MPSAIWQTGMTMMTKITKYLEVGIGGIHCPCCGPAPGTKQRKQLFRNAKRKEKKEALKIEEQNKE